MRKLTVHVGWLEWVFSESKKYTHSSLTLVFFEKKDEENNDVLLILWCFLISFLSLLNLTSFTQFLRQEDQHKHPLSFLLDNETWNEWRGGRRGIPASAQKPQQETLVSRWCDFRSLGDVVDVDEDELTPVLLIFAGIQKELRDSLYSLGVSKCNRKTDSLSDSKNDETHWVVLLVFFLVVVV